MYKSILQKDTERCLICHSNIWLEWHHVFGAAFKKKSEEYGLMARLCHYCHNEPPDGVHHNKENRLKLRAFAQKRAMAHHKLTGEQWLSLFGKNYL